MDYDTIPCLICVGKESTNSWDQFVAHINVVELKMCSPPQTHIQATSHILWAMTSHSYHKQTIHLVELHEVFLMTPRWPPNSLHTMIHIKINCSSVCSKMIPPLILGVRKWVGTHSFCLPAILWFQQCHNSKCKNGNIVNNWRYNEWLYCQENVPNISPLDVFLVIEPWTNLVAVEFLCQSGWRRDVKITSFFWLM